MTKSDTKNWLPLLLRSGSAVALIAMAMPYAAQAQSTAPAQSNTQSNTQPPAASADATKAQSDTTSEQTNDDAGDNGDEIIVSGMRYSIAKSIETKRDAMNIVDAVVAEDIGKFPDENLAEALQRIPGVTITRNRGEGQNISVRGLGGDYNVTTLDGRLLATENTGRTFNFDVIAAELVGGLQVYKTPLAELTEGGIGSIVNIDTRRPLDLKDFTFMASAKAEYETNSKKTSPSASFLISDTFADGTIGVLLSATYSRKTLRQDSFIGEGFYDATDPFGVSVPYDTNGDGVVSKDAEGNPAPGPGSEYYKSVIPGYVRYSIAQDKRTRIGGSAALQWQASDNVLFTLDGLYSRYRSNGSDSQISFVNYDEDWTPGVPQVDEIKRNDAGEINYIKVGGSPVAEILNASTPRRAETYQIGFNATGTDGIFTWFVDASKSQAKDSNAGENRYIVARAVLDSYIVDATQGNLLPSMTLDPALSADTPFGAHYSYNYGTGITDKVTQFRIGGKLEPKGFLHELNFGMGWTRQAKDRRQFASANPSAFSNGGQYLTRDGYPFDPTLVESFGALNLFRLPGNVLVAPGFDSFLKGEPGTPPQPWPSFDYDKLYEYYLTVNPAAAEALIKPTYRPTSSYEIREDVMNGYARATFSADIFGRPLLLDVGARAALTSIRASGHSRRPEDYNTTPLPAPSPIKVSGDYFDFLPSANLKWEIADDLIFRASAAKVLTRPSLGQMSPYQAISVTNRTITRGNPDLEPFRANQADASIEWYLGKLGLISAAVYYKDIKSFTQTIETTENINGINWRVRQPGSSGFGGTIKGFEISAQQSFDPFLPDFLHGFGAQVNYTYTTSSFDDPELKGLPFTGMSKQSYNIVGFYERGGLAARVAYSRRGKYVSTPDGWGGPEWVAPYGQVDASLSYDITDQVTVVAEGTNLTNSRYWQYIDRPDQVSYLARFGRQVSLGVRFGF